MSKRISSSQSSAVDILNYKKFNVVLRVPQQPIYTLLQNIYEIDTGGVAAFDTLIKVRPELNSVTNGIILIDDEIPSGIGKAASDVRLWNTITVETLIGDKQAKKRIQKKFQMLVIFSYIPKNYLQKNYVYLQARKDYES